MEAAEVDRKLDRLVGPNACRRLEPGDDGRAGAVRVDSDLREVPVPVLVQVDKSLEHVVDENGLGVDVDVHELFGTERLNGLDASAQPPSVAAVAPAGLVERLRPDADRDRLPHVTHELGPRRLHLGRHRKRRRTNPTQ